jgi:hypothetical protein
MLAKVTRCHHPDLEHDKDFSMPTITTGKYLKREELTADGSTHTVISVEEQELPMGDGNTEHKWVLLLKGLKPLILNATNIRRAVGAFGSAETDDWIGQSIIAYDDPEIEYGGKVVGGVRLRAVPKPRPKPVKAGAPSRSMEKNGSDIPF